MVAESPAMDVVQGASGSVDAALRMMAEAVRKGDIKKASELGASLPDHKLSLSAAEVGIAPNPVTGQPATATLVAKGAQGSVMRATWQGRQVAVKVPRIGTTADLDRFRKEIALMAKLGSPDNHIMPLLGARVLPPGYFLVMPLAGDSLSHLLYTATPAWRPTWRQVLHIAIQLARALCCMHSQGIVHRDVKPENVMLMCPEELGTAQDRAQASPGVLLSDLGLACPVTELQEQLDPVNWGHNKGGRLSRPTGGFHKQSAVGTQEYCAPELLLHSAPHSPASDIFALAITLNELTTLTPPYSDCTRDGPPGLHTVLDTGYTRQQLAAAVAGEGLRPRPPLGAVPPGWFDLLDAAWATDMSRRPTAQQLLDQLTRLQTEVLPRWLSDQGLNGTEGLLGAYVSRHVSSATTASSSDMEVDSVGHLQGDAFVSKVLGDKTLDEIRQAACAVAPQAAAGAPAPAAGPAPWHEAWGAAGVAHWDYAAVTHSQAAVQGGPGNSGGMGGAQGGGSSGTGLHVSGGVVEAVGSRDTWEDRSVVLPSFPLASTTSAQAGGAQAVHPVLAQQGALFAVFDGHRGDAAAVMCQQRLPAVVQQQLAQVLTGQPEPVSHEDLCKLLKRAMRGTLLTLEQEFYHQWDSERRAALLQRGLTPGQTASTTPARASFPGCTATVALIMAGLLTVGNLGDGAALLGGDAGHVLLTRPHTAACAWERERLVRSGSGGPLWHDQGGGWRLPGCGLQVSRSIGDFDAKGLQPTPYHPVADVVVSHRALSQFLAQGTGLTAEPEVTQVQVQAHHQWLVLGSDGLWDALEPASVARMVADTVKHPAMTARRLVAEALDAGSEDNTSAVVAFLHPVTTLEKVFHDTRE